MRYSALLNDVESFELTVRGEEAELTHRVPGTRRALGRQCNELLLAWLVRLIRELTQQGWAPTEICLAHAAPTDAKPLQQHFEGTQLRFAMGFNALRFRASHLAQATSSGDPVMLAMVDEHADRILGSGQAEDVLHRIRTCASVGDWRLAGTIRSAPSTQMPAGRISVRIEKALMAGSNTPKPPLASSQSCPGCHWRTFSRQAMCTLRILRVASQARAASTTSLSRECQAA